MISNEVFPIPCRSSQDEAAEQHKVSSYQKLRRGVPDSKEADAHFNIMQSPNNLQFHTSWPCPDWPSLALMVRSSLSLQQRVDLLDGHLWGQEAGVFEAWGQAEVEFGIVEELSVTTASLYPKLS